MGHDNVLTIGVQLLRNHDMSPELIQYAADYITREYHGKVAWTNRVGILTTLLSGSGKDCRVVFFPYAIQENHQATQRLRWILVTFLGRERA